MLLMESGLAESGFVDAVGGRNSIVMSGCGDWFSSVKMYTPPPAPIPTASCDMASGGGSRSDVTGDGVPRGDANAETVGEDGEDSDGDVGDVGGGGRTVPGK